MLIFNCYYEGVEINKNVLERIAGEIFDNGFELVIKEPGGREIYRSSKIEEQMLKIGRKFLFKDKSKEVEITQNERRIYFHPLYEIAVSRENEEDVLMKVRKILGL